MPKLQAIYSNRDKNFTRKFIGKKTENFYDLSYGQVQENPFFAKYLKCERKLPNMSF